MEGSYQEWSTYMHIRGIRIGDDHAWKSETVSLHTSIGWVCIVWLVWTNVKEERKDKVVISRSSSTLVY